MGREEQVWNLFNILYSLLYIIGVLISKEVRISRVAYVDDTSLVGQSTLDPRMALLSEWKEKCKRQCRCSGAFKRSNRISIKWEAVYQPNDCKECILFLLTRVDFFLTFYSVYSQPTVFSNLRVQEETPLSLLLSIG